MNVVRGGIFILILVQICRYQMNMFVYTCSSFYTLLISILFVILRPFINELNYLISLFNALCSHLLFLYHVNCVVNVRKIISCSGINVIELSFCKVEITLLIYNQSYHEAKLKSVLLPKAFTVLETTGKTELISSQQF